MALGASRIKIKSDSAKMHRREINMDPLTTMLWGMSMAGDMGYHSHVSSSLSPMDMEEQSKETPCDSKGKTDADCIIDKSVKEISFRYNYTYTVFVELTRKMSTDNLIITIPGNIGNHLGLSDEESAKAFKELEACGVLIRYPKGVLKVQNGVDIGEKIFYMINPNAAYKVKDKSAIQRLWNKAGKEGTKIGKRFILKRRSDDEVVCDINGNPVVFTSDADVLAKFPLYQGSRPEWPWYLSEDHMGFYDSYYNAYHQVPESEAEDAKLIVDNSCRLPEYYKEFAAEEVVAAMNGN